MYCMFNEYSFVKVFYPPLLTTVTTANDQKKKGEIVIEMLRLTKSDFKVLFFFFVKNNKHRAFFSGNAG